MPYIGGLSFVSGIASVLALAVLVAPSPPAAPSASASAPSIAAPVAAPAEPARIAWHLDPSAHYAADIRMTHVIANDLSGIYKKLAGSKADPVTILEDRTVTIACGAADSIDASTTDVRHYGGMQAKDTSVMRRTFDYKGALAADGKRSPSDEPLVDAGDGAIAELPDSPLAVGQSWTFSRKIKLDRDLAEGTMTYTDTLQRVDVRAGHRIGVIAVKGAGKADVAADLKAKGFSTADVTLGGTAEFDLTDGLPGVQHYTAHAQWNTRVLWVHLGLVFDDTYDAAPWTKSAR